MYKKKILFLLILFFLLGYSQENSKPFLLNGEIIPYEGTVKKAFIARVYYYDADGDKPEKIFVYVDDVPYPLKLKKGSASAGWYYSQKLTLPPGEHKYYFYCEDGKGKSDRFPRYGEKTGPLVGVHKKLNRKPKLEKGGVYFEEGEEDKIFVFRVNYYDPDCQPPQAVMVIVDGRAKPMKLYKGKPSDGVYIARLKLEPMKHGYYFLAIDDQGEKVSLPEEGYLIGPIVYEKENTLPILTDCKVKPELGGPSTTFTFSVFYKDEDKDPPAIIQVVIDNIPYDMKLVKGEKHYGIYQFKKKLQESKFHSYYFYCEDIRGGIRRIPERGAFNGPIVIK
ncbi:MAG: hypothetical protein N2323_03365 [candidate division WOR-3 bacterium]|nr:hypothetical protein [candidate division WOR-3 bacterium]MCX7836980.1 hypothetical protein [candidate division WOR-3 bacterium]MDW8114108.1 hypothetical protein [candidate division WOR-3 bacterium]